MASTKIGAMRIDIGADSAQFDKAMSNVQRKLNGAGKNFETFGSKMSAMGARLSQGLAAAFATTSIVAAGGAYLKLADQAKQLSAQLQLATAQFGSFGQAQKDVNRIAAETRNGLTETGSLYANFMRATREIGGTQQQAARATETFSKTLKISGADASEAASATLQFGQALASGVLRGDEFNSIMEASPRLARLLADSLGVPIGSLRKMAEEGQLTADRLFRALTDRKFTDGIDAEFKQMPVTFGEAMDQVHNAAVTAFGAFDQGGQFSTALSSFVLQGSTGFGNMASAAEQMGITIRSELAGITAVAQQLIDTVSSIGSMFQTVDSKLGGVITKLNYIAGWFNPLNSVSRFVLGGGTYENARVTTEQKLQGESAQRRFDQMTSGYDVMGNRKGAGYRPAPVVASGGGSKKGGASKPRAGETEQEKALKRQKEMAEKISRIMDAMYPETAGLRKELEALAALEADPNTAFPALMRQRQLVADAAEKSRLEQLGGELENVPGALDEAWASVQATTASMAEKIAVSTSTAGEAFVNMANQALNALSNLANAIKGGGILDILSSAFNAFGSVAGTGAFGKGLQNSFKSFTPIAGFRAAGGPVSAGKTYVVGENGPELFTARQSGTIIPNIDFNPPRLPDRSDWLREMPGLNHQNMAPARVVVDVVPSPYFDAHVRNQALAVARPMAVAAGNFGSQAAQIAMQRKASRRIPGQ
ncbi:hypothetical protein TomMM35A_18480 [Sphingobium sp. TomMM35A]